MAKGVLAAVAEARPPVVAVVRGSAPLARRSPRLACDRRCAPDAPPRRAVLLLWALSVAFAAGVAAQPEATVLEEQRVTATALALTPAAASQHISVLGRADLESLRGLSLAEILSRQAGIVVDRSARSGGYGALYLRGADPSHVVVLIDHVRQNDPLSSRGSAVDLNTLSVDDIERIEIVRGNASVANAEAIAGLIHIFTRRATPGAEIRIGAGGDGLRSGYASWSGAGPRLSAAQHEDGDGADGFSRSRALNAAWERRFSEDGSLRAAARFADSDNRGFPDDSGGRRYAVLRTPETRRGDSRQLSVRSEFAMPVGTFEAQAVALSRRGDEVTPGVAPGLRDPFGLPPISGRSDYRRDEAQAAWRVAAGDALLLTLGSQYQRERGSFDSLIDFGSFQLPAAFLLRRRTASAFAEARWQAGDWAVQGGVRYERASGDAAAHGGRAPRPMLSLQRGLGEGRGSWGASLAQTAKLPSFYALGQPLVGNPQLKPESARHRELYYATSPGSAWPSRFTLFSARYRDLIDFDAGPPPQLVNRARIDADGLEWSSRHRFGNDWQLQLDGTWMRVRDVGGDASLRHRPRVQAAARLDLPLGGQRELSLDLRHLGRRLDSSIPTGDRRLAAATTLNLVLSQPLGTARLLLALDNAGNARSEETIGTPLPGRRVRLSLQWGLW